MDQDSNCVVVGFGPGMGAALARRFAASGMQVTGLARDPSRHAALAGAGIRLEAADAGDFAALGRIVGALEPEVVIFNAYKMTMLEGGPSALDPATLLDDFRVNVGGALAAARAALPAMLRRGRGTILFTGGGLALDPTGWLPAASLAVGKAALRNLTLSMHAELAPKHIHVATVTVTGQIQPGTAFDPNRIAEAFLALHQEPAGAFRPEIVFSGA